VALTAARQSYARARIQALLDEAAMLERRGRRGEGSAIDKARLAGIEAEARALIPLLTDD
jgi:hypothetical protein